MEVTDIAKIVRKKIRFWILLVKNVKKKHFDFTDEKSYKRQSCRILKNRNKWFEPKKDIIEDNVRETNVRTFVEVTDIAKIVRKKSVFGFYR